MKVKDLIKFIDEIEYDCEYQTYHEHPGEVCGQISLKDFKRYYFERNYEEYKTYENFNELSEDTELLEMEVLKIKKIDLYESIYINSNNNPEINNDYKLEIILK